MKCKSLAIIPARSGSKGLPDKNIRVLKGKELIAYTIEAAVKSNSFNKVILSTDSKIYAKIGEKYGAEIPELRPGILSGDSVSSIEVVLHCLSLYEKRGIYFDSVCLLQPTSPLRTSENIKEAYQLFCNSKANSVVSVCECEHSPLWTNTIESDLRIDNFIKNEVKDVSRQKLPVYYRLNGAIYIASCDFIIKNKSFIGENSLAYIMKQRESVDIDSLDDFRYAEFLLSREFECEKL